MKRFTHLHGIQHHDIVGKKAVQPFQNFFGFQPGAAVKINHLPSSMHSGIGASRSPHTHLASQHNAEAGFDCFLDGKASGLPLPSVISGTVVLQYELYIAPGFECHLHSSSMAARAHRPDRHPQGNPHMIFILQTAWPEAPLVRLSITEITITLRVRSSTFQPRSQ